MLRLLDGVEKKFLKLVQTSKLPNGVVELGLKRI